MMKWVVVAGLAVLTVISMCPRGNARDVDGRYAQSPLKEWFSTLTNRKGSRCCDDGDGKRLEDPDWMQTSENESGYRVRLVPGGPWVDVQPGSLVTERNKVGFAVVWPVFAYNATGEAIPVEVLCFMPGNTATRDDDARNAD